jgi:hypothetical protein
MKTITLNVLCECEALSLIKRDEHRFRVFQNRMLRTFESKRKKWETKETYMKGYINLYLLSMWGTMGHIKRDVKNTYSFDQKI